MKLKEIRAKIKKFNRIVAYVGIVAVLILAFLGVAAEVFKKEPAEKLPPIIDPVFEEIPSPIFDTVPNLTWSKSVATTIPSKEEIPASLPVYKLISGEKLSTASESASIIASRLGIDTPLNEVEDAWFTDTPSSFLRIEKKDLFWSYKRQLENTGTRVFSKELLLSNFFSFLKDRGFFKEILNEANVKVTLLDTDGFVLLPAKDPNNPGYYRFDFHLQKDSIPIVSENLEEFVISATLTKFGEVFTIDYSLGEVLLEKSGLYPTLEYSKALNFLMSGKGAIVSTGTSVYNEFVGTGVVTSLNVVAANLVYYQDVMNGFLVPVWQFEGEGKLENGVYVNLKVWLPGISHEWLK